jgi:hypothetical protein
MPAFVVQHVEGTAPDAGECQAFLRRLRAALSETELRISLPGWQRNKDFRCPRCNHNLLRDAGGTLSYIDFQNFSLRDRRRLLPRVRGADTREAHDRFAAVRRLLAEHGVELDGRLVLDVACGTGAVLHQALSAGAWWAVGRERAAAAAQAQAIAVTRGFTRLDIVGHGAEGAAGLRDAVPGWLGPHLDESVVLCLGAPGPRAMLASVIAAMPWRALVHAAPPGTTDTPPDPVVAFTTAGARVVHRARAGTMGTGERALCLLIREPAAATSARTRAR